jgi:hypothetical protein
MSFFSRQDPVRHPGDHDTLIFSVYRTLHIKEIGL